MKRVAPLVAGGDGSNVNVLTSAELYNLSNGTWTATGSLNTSRTYHTATLLTNGMVLVAGGEDSSNVLNSAELYTPSSAPPPLAFQITSFVLTNATDLLITWNTSGASNIVQVTGGTGASGNYSTNGFTDVTNFVVTTTTTNFWDVGGATNKPARYYRIRSPQ